MEYLGKNNDLKTDIQLDKLFVLRICAEVWADFAALPYRFASCKSDKGAKRQGVALK